MAAPEKNESGDDAGLTEDAKEATKRKFREALEAKHGRRGEAHIDADPAAPEPHGPVSEKRTFRRKTG